MSSTDVKVFFVKVNSSFNLSAPGAAKFDEPCALSSKVLSSPESITVSATATPTLYEGVFENLSSMIVCFAILKNYH